MTPHTLPEIPAFTTPAVEAALDAVRRARHVDARKCRRLERELIMIKAASLIEPD